MASRAELVDEAVLLVAGAENVLWILAINEVPLRRSHFLALTELSNQVVVKALARLANASMLAATDGLEFSMVTPEMRREVASRIPDAERKALHDASLELEKEQPGFGARYVLGHLLGAERWQEASEHLFALMESGDTGLAPMALVARIERILKGLEAEGGENLTLREDLLLRLLDVGRPFLGPKKMRGWVRELEEAGLQGERAERLVEIARGVDEELKGRAAKRKAEKAAAQAAEAEANAAPSATAPEPAKTESESAEAGA